MARGAQGAWLTASAWRRPCRPAGRRLLALRDSRQLPARRPVGTSMLLARVPSTDGQEVAVVDLLRFIHNEIHGSSTHFMESVSELSEMMEQLDLSPGETVLLEDAKEIVEHLGASPEHLDAFVTRVASQDPDGLYCQQCGRWYMGQEAAGGQDLGPGSTSWTGGCRGHCGCALPAPWVIEGLPRQ